MGLREYRLRIFDGHDVTMCVNYIQIRWYFVLGCNLVLLRMRYCKFYCKSMWIVCECRLPQIRHTSRTTIGPWLSIQTLVVSHTGPRRIWWAPQRYFRTIIPIHFHLLNNSQFNQTWFKSVPGNILQAAKMPFLFLQTFCDFGKRINVLL